MKIAIAFFGITRHLPSVIDSINNLIINPLREISDLRIFSHLYLNEKINNPRSSESGVRQVDECFLLNSDHLCLEKDSLCLGSWSYEQAIQHRDVFNDGYISVRNLYHQLSSLHKVTGMMNEFDPDYVVFLRPDLLYHDPMLEVVKSFIEDRKYNILTPSWHRWSGENDRLAIADRIGAKVYGERVKYAGQFIEKFKYIHSEQLLKFVIDQSRVSHGHFDARASRVRLGGVVKPEDFSL